MQTFLPYPDIARSVEALDPRRLGKQRVEAMQILRTLRGETRGWRNHPAVRMWDGHERTLAVYMDACIREWKLRGFVNNMPVTRIRRFELPPWFGDDAFHASHRANLLRKDAAYYGAFGWTEDPATPYHWPV